MTGSSLISIRDISTMDLRAMVDRASAFSAGEQSPSGILADAVVGLYFAKTSTRTRTAFSAGAARMGASVITYGPGDLQINTGETNADTGHVLGRMLDLLVARTAGPERELIDLAAHGLPVVNAMSALEHPTQALADLTTIQRSRGSIEGVRVAYLGEGNNTAAALALALSRLPDIHLELRTPPGYGLPEEIRAGASAQADLSGATIVERHDMDEFPTDLDFIYTTRWQTTGTSKADPDWRATFAPFHVTADLWRDNPRAHFLHDLPAHRGEEVTGEVLDGPRSLAFDQAENKLHSAMAALEWCLRPATRAVGAQRGAP